MNAQVWSCVQMVQGLTGASIRESIVNALKASLLAFLIRITFSPAFKPAMVCIDANISRTCFKL